MQPPVSGHPPQADTSMRSRGCPLTGGSTVVSHDAAVALLHDILRPTTSTTVMVNTLQTGVRMKHQFPTFTTGGFLKNMGLPLMWLVNIREITINVFPSPMSSARTPPLTDSGRSRANALVVGLCHKLAPTFFQNKARSVLFSLFIIHCKACCWCGNSSVVITWWYWCFIISSCGTSTQRGYKHIWRAPSKGGVCTYFVAIFQVARNPLKFGMPILFVLKHVPVFFFQESRKIWTKLHENPSPLCPSPNIVGFRSLRTKTLCMCVFYAIGGWGGGGLSRACLKPRFPACEKEKQRDIFWHKKSQHAKFQRIPGNLKNRTEKGTYASDGALHMLFHGLQVHIKKNSARGLKHKVIASSAKDIIFKTKISIKTNQHSYPIHTNAKTSLIKLV